MKLLRDNLVKNIEIALTLQPIQSIYLLNHQDCGAIKAFLGCSGYPETLGSNNEKEIQINSSILTYAQKYIKKKLRVKRFA
jgi:carbonic anhydrase